MSMQPKLVCLVFFISLLFGGCARGDTVIKPAEIHYGQDACAECNMIISDPRYAASYAREISEGRYESLSFDDIGDMVTHAQKHATDKVVGWYVHDYQSQEWIDATQAFYVLSHDIRSPMGHGLAAHTARTAAAQMATTVKGEVLTWAELQKRYQS